MSVRDQQHQTENCILPLVEELSPTPFSLILMAPATVPGIANEAEAHNDSLLLLDAVGPGSSAKDAATSSYALFNGASYPCLLWLAGTSCSNTLEVVIEEMARQ